MSNGTPKKRLRIAVIGAPASGKSYLLYDLIHAFHLLGYQAKELPLSYPHSSFGAYFHDAFNPKTGGMRGTEQYICRPQNHYGAHLYKKGKLGLTQNLAVDFLNIPGEAFILKSTGAQDNESDTIEMFFELKGVIEQCGKGYFVLQQWQSPAGHIRSLILPVGKKLKTKTFSAPTNDYKYANLLQWSQLENELGMGCYHLKRLKSINGQWILNHLTELDTDSFILSIKDQWDKLPVSEHGQQTDYDAMKTFVYLYPLVYCQNATDLVICDRLTATTNAAILAERVCEYMYRLTGSRPHVYLAFREAELLLKPYGYKERRLGNSTTERNRFYGLLMSSMLKDHHFGSYVFNHSIKRDYEEHVLETVGNGESAFWQLLRASYNDPWIAKLAQIADPILPPHVYFTSTPIDSNGHLYTNDEDKTRFIDENELTKRSFVNEVCQDMSRHACFGSLQLLLDILLQNHVRLGNLAQQETRGHIQYFQGMTKKLNYQKDNTK